MEGGVGLSTSIKLKGEAQHHMKIRQEIIEIIMTVLMQVMSKYVKRIEHIIVLLVVIQMIYLGCNLNEKNYQYPYVSNGIYENIVSSLPDSLFSIVVKENFISLFPMVNCIYFINGDSPYKEYFCAREMYYYNTIQYSDSLFRYVLLVKRFQIGDRAAADESLHKTYSVVGASCITLVSDALKAGGFDPGTTNVLGIAIKDPRPNERYEKIKENNRGKDISNELAYKR